VLHLIGRGLLQILGQAPDRKKRVKKRMNEFFCLRLERLWKQAPGFDRQIHECEKVIDGSIRKRGDHVQNGGKSALIRFEGRTEDRVDAVLEISKHCRLRLESQPTILMDNGIGTGTWRGKKIWPTNAVNGRTMCQAAPHQIQWVFSKVDRV
jgi:hypothetical protein